MRTITYMKGGQVLTREVPDLTVEEQTAIDARKALIAKERLQKVAEADKAALRIVALDQIIKDGSVSQELRDYAVALDSVISADPKTDVIELPAKPNSLEPV